MLALNTDKRVRRRWCTCKSTLLRLLHPLNEVNIHVFKQISLRIAIGKLRFKWASEHNIHARNQHARRKISMAILGHKV